MKDSYGKFDDFKDLYERILRVSEAFLTVEEHFNLLSISVASSKYDALKTNLDNIKELVDHQLYLMVLGYCASKRSGALDEEDMGKE